MRFIEFHVTRINMTKKNQEHLSPHWTDGSGKDPRWHSEIRNDHPATCARQGSDIMADPDPDGSRGGELESL